MQKIMNYILTRILPLLVMLAATSCSSISVMSDFDRNFDFNRSLTYQWVNPPGDESPDLLSANPLIRKRIQDAVSSELDSRGFSPAGLSRPDLLLVVRAYVKEKSFTRYDMHPFHHHFFYHGRLFRYYPGFDPFYEEPVTDYYEEGNLVVDMLDEKGMHLVWRGSARGYLKKYRTGESMQKDIDLAVSEIFSDFPSPKHTVR